MITGHQSMERFSVRHRPNIAIGERVTWGCIDERNMLLRGLLLQQNVDGKNIVLLDRRQATAQSLLYKQTASGPFGVGKDTNISLRLAKLRNSRGDLSLADQAIKNHSKSAEQPSRKLPPSYVLGSMAAKALRAEGIDLLAHKGCAAEMAADTIGWGIATNKGPNGEDIFETIKDMQPGGLKRSRFNDISGVYGDALTDGMIASLEESTPAIAEGADTPFGSIQPVGRAALVGINHVSPNMVIDWRRNVALDAEAAIQASDIADDGSATPGGDIWASYHTSMGDMGQIADTVQDLFPAIDPQDFIDAAFVRNAATSLFLPRQINAETPVQLYAVNA
jgi:hypothetical protein